MKKDKKKNSSVRQHTDPGSGLFDDGMQETVQQHIMEHSTFATSTPLEYTSLSPSAIIMRIKDENRIKVSTAAKLRGVKRQAIYWHIAEGNLDSMELDGNVYVDREQVLLWKPKGAGEYRPRKKGKTDTK